MRNPTNEHHRIKARIRPTPARRHGRRSGNTFTSGPGHQPLAALEVHCQHDDFRNQRRPLNLSLEDGKVTFRWKDYAHGTKQRTMILGVHEFLRRFFLHVLPHGFVRIRFFGFLANRSRGSMLPLCRRLLETSSQECTPALPVADAPPPAGWRCPCCSGPMVIIGTLTAQRLRQMAFEQNILDTS